MFDDFRAAWFTTHDERLEREEVEAEGDLKSIAHYMEYQAKSTGTPHKG